MAINALVATKNPKYDAVIAGARKYLLSHQADEGEGYKPDHPFYGGIGYGGGERPDLSNVYIVLEGLKAAATDPKDPVWQKALQFVNRTQNRSDRATTRSGPPMTAALPTAPARTRPNTKTAPGPTVA